MIAFHLFLFYFNDTDVLRDKRWKLDLDNKGDVFIRDSYGLESSCKVSSLMWGLEIVKILNNYDSCKKGLLSKWSCDDCTYLLKDNYCSIYFKEIMGDDVPCEVFEFKYEK